MLLSPDTLSYRMSFLLLSLLCVYASAQTVDSLSLPARHSLGISQADSSLPDLRQAADTLQVSLWPALIRSAIIPGWGQIEQEYPGKAVIFYGLGLSCLYNIAYNYSWYQKTSDYTNKLKMRHFALAYLQLYVINLVDIIETHNRGSDKPWPQDLYSDIPMKSPWGAVARSAMLPGWGQIYNKSYVKSVVAFGACFYFASRIYSYEKKYLETGDVQFRDQRVTNSWYFGFAYFLVMVDAYIDAYLYRFDDAINFSYQFMPLDNSFRVGVQLAF